MIIRQVFKLNREFNLMFTIWYLSQALSIKKWKNQNILKKTTPNCVINNRKLNFNFNDKSNT